MSLIVVNIFPLPGAAPAISSLTDCQAHEAEKELDHCHDCGVNSLVVQSDYLTGSTFTKGALFLLDGWLSGFLGLAPEDTCQ